MCQLNFALIFAKTSFRANLVKKSILSDFERISGFCSSLRMDSISTWKFSKIDDNFSLDSFQDQEVNRWNPEPEARKTQIFKVLYFEPNFRGRLYMTSKGTQWPHLIKKNLTNWFIHDSNEVYAFPQILSLMDPQFFDLVPNPF